jgi:2-methylcitrate dehydratase PrpD
LPLSRLIREHAVEHFAAGRRSARILFDGRAVSPVGAALAGGMTIDALDAHDGHRLTKGHAGCGVLPAVLALMDAENHADERELLVCLILGYEIGTRAGIALHRLAAEYHTSGAWIAVTSAALGARLLRLDRPATRHALGIGEYHGPRSPMMRCIDHPTMVKDGSGWGAMAGVSAAYLAAGGFSGAPAVLVESADAADLWADLGSRWRIFEQYFKPYPVCRWAQPAVEAALALQAAHGVPARSIVRIEAESFAEAVRLATRHPANTEEAQYSLPFPVAAAAVRRRVGVEEVTGEAFADPDIDRLSASMGLIADTAFSARFPNRRFARVRFVLSDGRHLVSGVTEAFGDPENPAELEHVRAKFFENARHARDRSRLNAIERAVDELAAEGSANRFLLDLVLAPL